MDEGYLKVDKQQKVRKSRERMQKKVDKGELQVRKCPYRGYTVLKKGTKSGLGYLVQTDKMQKSTQNVVKVLRSDKTVHIIHP